MTKSGKWLEKLVSEIEGAILPPGFHVATNEIIFNEDGTQIAEFDLVITGKIGSTDLRWLVECRDRPSQGPASGEWILSLIGRKDYHLFDKVTAVSTTGFSPGAIQYARDRGIDLRSVESLTTNQVASWINLESITVIERTGQLQSVKFVVTPESKREAVMRVVNTLVSVDTPILIHSTSKRESSPLQVWEIALDQNPSLFDGLNTDNNQRQALVRVNFPNPNDSYLIRTDQGEVLITQLVFTANLSVLITEVPISQITEYSKTIEGKTIAQSLHFRLQREGQNMEFKFHKLSENNEIVVTMRGTNSGKNQG